MAFDHFNRPLLEPEPPLRRASKAGYCGLLALPFAALIVIIAIQEISASDACRLAADGRCVFGLVDAQWLQTKLATPLLHAHRHLSLPHYIIYGALFAVLAHRAFQSLVPRLTATALATGGAMVPTIILEIYSAWIVASGNCSATADCTMVAETVFFSYAPFAVMTLSLVLILPTVGIVTVIHAIAALGIEIFGRRMREI